jgi:hypothetical protein
MERMMAMLRKNRKTEPSTRRLTGLTSRLTVGAATLSLSLSVAAIARAQNSFGQDSGSRFKAAPRSAEAEAEAEAAAANGPEMILGIDVNTIFFIAAAVIAVFWFTLGGGRKPKVSRH